MEDRISMGSHSDGNSFHNLKVDGFSINGKYSRKCFFNHLFWPLALIKLTAFFQSTLAMDDVSIEKILTFIYQGWIGRKSNLPFIISMQSIWKCCFKIFNVHTCILQELYYKNKLEFIKRHKYGILCRLIKNGRKQYFSCWFFRDFPILLNHERFIRNLSKALRQ